MDELVKWIVMKRDMSVVVGLISERLPDLNGESIHARRAMSVEMPPGYEVIHGNDLDTVLD